MASSSPGTRKTAGALGGCGEKDKDKAASKPRGSAGAPAGPDSGTTPPRIDVKARDEMGFTPLLDAAARHTDIADAVRLGADVNAGDKEIGWTALHWRASDEDVDMISQLVAARADVDATDLAGKTPLHEACKSGHVSAVQALLAAGANPNRSDLRGMTPLHYAVRPNKQAIVELLLARRVEVNAATKAGLTPMQMALVGGQSQMSDLLRSRGAATVKLPVRQNPLPQRPPAAKPN